MGDNMDTFSAKGVIYGEVIDRVVDDDGNVGIKFKGVPEIRPVFGKLGDPGLEPKWGMKVWCDVYGGGEIDAVEKSADGEIRGIRVKLKRFSHPFLFEPPFNLYVTARLKEPKGYAVHRHLIPFTSRYDVSVYSTSITKKDAMDKFGDKLLHWIPETEVNK